MVSIEHIWSVNEKRLNSFQRLGLTILKRFVITWECITKNHIMSYASALTYSSMLAAVPVLAIVFAIARGFGFDTMIETKLRSSLEGSNNNCAYAFDVQYLNCGNVNMEIKDTDNPFPPKAYNTTLTVE